MAAMVGVWEVEMDNGWNPYDGASNASLESSYTSNPTSACQLNVSPAARCQHRSGVC